MRLAYLLIVALLSACGSEPALVTPYDPSVAEAQIPDVLSALRRGDPDAALTRLDDLAQAGTLPDGAEHYRAIALMDAGRDDDARAAWQAELDAHPGNGRAHAFLAEILLEDGQLDEAAGHLEEATRLLPHFAATALMAGRLALLRNDDVAAERLFGDYLESDPYGAEATLAHESLKQIYARRGPAFAERAAFHGNIADYLRDLHRHRASFRQRLLQDPTDAEAAFGIANTYLSLYFRTSDGDERLLGEADRALQRVLEIDPDYARALANLGSIRAERGRLEEAHALFTRATEIDSKLFEPRVQLGLIEARAGNIDVARDHFDTAIQIADNDEERAQAHAKKGYEFADAAPAEALVHLDEYLVLAPNDPANLRSKTEALRATLDG